LLAGLLLAGILLLGESEIPFLFGFRTAMTDVVTTFSQRFDAGSTAPIVVPLVSTVVVAALLLVQPLFKVLLPSSRGGRGIVRVPARHAASVVTFGLPLVAAASLLGYARGLGSTGLGSRLWAELPAVRVSIVEPVACAWVTIAIALLAAYPA